ncbi:hypothetical protein M408DRAFT_36373, partial [Serendipita vermifera MAFF 305830]
PNFPEHLWNAILKHGYVEFDKLNGVQHSAVYEEDGITTLMDWLYCYVAYEKAVVWAYPHRQKELREYYDTFHQLFRSYAPGAHVRLINLDRAIRSEVASSSLLKLTDPSLFARLREQYLSPDGAGY